MCNPIPYVVAVVLALIGGAFWLAYIDAKQMEERRVAFMSECTAERAAYDCRLQWDTYASARAAEGAATAAAINSGFAAGTAAGR